MKMPRYTVSTNNVHIVDSWKVSKRDFSRCLARIESEHSECETWNRRRWSLRMEWAAHNALYLIGVFRSRTKDVDLNYPLRWWVALGYNTLGALVWVLIP